MTGPVKNNNNSNVNNNNNNHQTPNSPTNRAQQSTDSTPTHTLSLLNINSSTASIKRLTEEAFKKLSQEEKIAHLKFFINQIGTHKPKTGEDVLQRCACFEYLIKLSATDPNIKGAYSLQNIQDLYGAKAFDYMDILYNEEDNSRAINLYKRALFCRPKLSLSPFIPDYVSDIKEGTDTPFYETEDMFDFIDMSQAPQESAPPNSVKITTFSSLKEIIPPSHPFQELIPSINKLRADISQLHQNTISNIEATFNKTKKEKGLKDDSPLVKQFNQILSLARNLLSTEGYISSQNEMLLEKYYEKLNQLQKQIETLDNKEK